MKKKLIIIGSILTATSIVWLPMIALAVSNPDKLEFYIKALEYGLKGLKEYFQFIIELFKLVMS